MRNSPPSCGAEYNIEVEVRPADLADPKQRRALSAELETREISGLCASAKQGATAPSPSFSYISPERVAEEGVKGLYRNRRRVVPSLFTKFLTAGAPLLPRGFAVWSNGVMFGAGAARPQP